MAVVHAHMHGAVISFRLYTTMSSQSCKVKLYMFSVFLHHFVVREEKNIKLHTFADGRLQKLYCHNVYSPAMAFSEDGSLFAYCDGTM